MKEGQYYDALQLCRAIFQRFLKKKDLTGGVAFAEEFAEKFAEHGQYELTISLGQRVLEELVTNNSTVIPTMDYCEKLSTFFLLCPSNSTEAKYTFMHKLIQWSRGCDELSPTEKEEGSSFLHSLMADAYLAEGKYGSCQNHIIFCEDAQLMTELIRRWQIWGYPSETHSFLLRLVLILLSRRQIQVAGQLLKELKFSWDNPNLPGPLQAAYLVWASCAELCHELFAHVQKKYVLIFRVDPTLQKLLLAVESSVFGIHHEQGGIMGMLQQMLGGPNHEGKSSLPAPNTTVASK